MTATPWPGPQRHEFTTTDPELAREFLNQAYGIRVLVSNVREGMTRLAATRTDVGPFTVSDVTLPGDLTFGTTGSDTVSIDTVIAGTIQDDRAKDTNRYQPGDVVLGSWPQASFTSRTHRVRARALTLPVSLLYTVAGRAPSAPLRFASPRPASAADRTRWTSTTGYIDTLLASPAAAASPLIIASAARLLAAATLVVFPNSWDTDPAARDRTDASTATLRRAIAFIDEHAARDISIADVAAAAHVTIRAVQIAFRRHYGTTPAGYLRRVRLERARQDLLAADPATESVTAVAYRWGFASPGQFTAAYQQAYGLTPDQTLRQD
ncbi:MAG TPA: AraC family transcriptional regulator [Streptosporangiaceae bacterium]|nr:AraC family transcriptional regulator [Streptosporangiaceae bacterium]